MRPCNSLPEVIYFLTCCRHLSNVLFNLPYYTYFTASICIFAYCTYNSQATPYNRRVLILRDSFITYRRVAVIN